MSVPEYGFTDFQKASNHLILAGLVIGTLVYFYSYARRMFNLSFLANFPFVRNMNFFVIKNFLTFIVFLLILLGFLGMLDLVNQMKAASSA